MDALQFAKNLKVPQGPVDVVLDTDTYNEIDDQFALAYLLRSDDFLHIKGLYAAPFYNEKSSSPEDGMLKSEQEIHKVLSLAGREDLAGLVQKGSRTYLADEHTPVESDAAMELIRLSRNYDETHPLYVAAIGAITNVASALLMDPSLCERIVVVWLGGNSREFQDTREFNMDQDIAASRVVFANPVPLVQLPCRGVVSQFTVSRWDLEHFLKGRGPLPDYLADNTIRQASSYAAGRPWTRVIWDVTTIGWLLNQNNQFMLSRTVKAMLPGYDRVYHPFAQAKDMTYVYDIHRDALMEDLFSKVVSGHE